MSSRRRHTICALVTGVQTCALPIKYSPVDGATANALADHVPAEVMEDRYHRFMEKQQAISAAKLQRKVGQTIEVLVDAINEDADSVGRSWADAPEIDGKVARKSTRMNSSH